MFTRRFTGIWFVAAFLTVAQMIAADSSSVIGPGATRDELIKAYGAPTGTTKYGNLEILHYRNGQARLVNGRVERLSLKTIEAPVTAQAAPITVAKGIPAEAKSPLADIWITDFDAATRDATRRNSVILTLFTTSDASPTSRQFQQELVFHPDFVNAFRAHYVLLHVDFPVRNELPPEIRRLNEALRDRYGVRRFPALLILSATGEKLAEIEISDSVPGSAFRARLIAAVAAAHELPVPAAPPPAPAKEAPAPVAVETPILVAPSQVTSALITARWLVTGALIVGTLIAAVMLFVLWLVLRKINKPVALNRRSSMASRISHAASGLPSHAEILEWSKETLCHVTTRLAEREGYLAEAQRSNSDKDLVLKRPGNPTPKIVVCCVTGRAGVISTRLIREMVGILVADDVPAGWFVAPMGFSLDARAYAEQHNIRLIDGSGLLEQLSDLPSFALPKVLAAAR